MAASKGKTAKGLADTYVSVRDALPTRPSRLPTCARARS